MLDAATDSKAGDIVCVLDAIDECEENQQIKLIEALKSLYQDANRTSRDDIRLRFLLTSRPYREISARFHTLVSRFPTVHLSGDGESDLIRKEIECVMRSEVEAIASERSLDSKTQEVLLQQLLNVQHRTYLWLHLVLDQIRTSERAGTAKEIRKEFLSLPQSVNSAYEAILGKTKNRNTVLKLLQIIVGAEGPMTIDDLNVALNLEDTSTSYEALELEKSHVFAQRIRNVCGLFLYVDRSYVYLIHQTAKDFLLQKFNDSEPPNGRWENSLRYDETQTLLANICMQFLMLANFGEEKNWNEDTSDEEILQCLGKYQFLAYAGKHWIIHLSQCESSLQRKRLQWILCLLDTPSPRFQVWFRVRRNFEDREPCLPPNSTSLILASSFGLTIILEHLLHSGTDTNGEDSHGATALHRAIDQGDVDLVRILLENGADVEASNWEEPWREEIDDDGNERNVKSISGIPIWFAAFCHKVEIVRLLAEFGADVDRVSDMGEDVQCTALQTLFLFSVALSDGEDTTMVEMIRLLLDSGANVNQRFEGRACPRAIYFGGDIHLMEVEQPTLLQRVVVEDEMWAWRILSEFKADLGAEVFLRDYETDSSGDEDEGSEMQLEPMDDDEVSTRHQGSDLSVVSLGSEEDPQTVDLAIQDCRSSILQISKVTAMHLAVVEGRNEILACMLSMAADAVKREDRLSTSDETEAPRSSASTALSEPKEPTLLHLAAILGRYETSSQLLEAAIVDINAEDHEGNTALQKACLHGRDDVKDLLISAGARVSDASQQQQPPLDEVEGSHKEKDV